MKKWLSIICMCSFILSFGSVSALAVTKSDSKITMKPQSTTSAKQSIDDDQMKDVLLDDGLLYDNPDTLAEIEGYSDIIVEGRPTGDPEQVIVRDTDGIYVKHGYTLTTITIDKVYKGDVRVGDTVKVAESYYILDNKLYHHGLYYPSEAEKTYIWFLMDLRPGYEHYASPMCERGRYPVINRSARNVVELEDLNKEELNLSPSGKETDEIVYRNILKDVAEKYMK